MANHALINKEIIPFICDRKKVTIDYLINKTGYKKDKIIKWLDVNDSTLPTIIQAKKIAKTLNIPFAGLYMNKEDIKISSIPQIRNFRSINGNTTTDDSSVNIAICAVLDERLFVLSACQELELVLPELSLPICSGNEVEFASAIRKHFGIDINRQFKCNSMRQFYLYLREQLERKGIFVQCFIDVPVETARAFAVYDEHMPVIGLNDSDRAPAKSFSMIHELVHLIKRESSMCNDMYNSMTLQREEVFCNAVAGEVLVPKHELQKVLSRLSNTGIDLNTIRRVADKFSVSREVIIRRFLDLKLINQDEYSNYSDVFKSELESDRAEQKILRELGKSTGVYRNITHETINRFSSTTCNTLFCGYTENYFSKRDIAIHLGIAQKHVDKFLKEVSGWNN